LKPPYVTATANGIAGSYTVTAAVTGVGETAVFDLTNADVTTDLSITIDDGRNYARYGMTLNYLVTIQNNGAVDANDVSVSNAFPPQLDYSAAHADTAELSTPRYHRRRSRFHSQAHRRSPEREPKGSVQEAV